MLITSPLDNVKVRRKEAKRHKTSRNHETSFHAFFEFTMITVHLYYIPNVLRSK